MAEHNLRGWWVTESVTGEKLVNLLTAAPAAAEVGEGPPAGDRLDGATIVAVLPVHLSDGGTYDLLPSGPTGDYWAGGVLLGSTLAGD